MMNDQLSEKYSLMEVFVGEDTNTHVRPVSGFTGISFEKASEEKERKINEAMAQARIEAGQLSYTEEQIAAHIRKAEMHADRRYKVLK